MAIPAASSRRESGRDSLAQADAAPQREAVAAPQVLEELAPTAIQRARGPHPLPLFLATVARVCGGDRDRLARVLAGVRRYQAAADPAPRPARAIVAAAGGVTLRDHGRPGDPILVVVPSLINPATVLDLAPDNSLLGALAARGIRPLLVDWGRIPDTDPAGLVSDHLVPLIAGLDAPVALAGYCLGGTLALAAAQALGARVERLALLATPWRFSAYAAAMRDGGSDWWAQTRQLATQLGGMPIDLLQPAFWALDPAGLAAKYARLATLPAAEAEAFVRLEDWSNSGATLPLPVMTAVFEDFFGDDRPGRGAWTIAGRIVDPAGLACPILDIVAERDRLVPPAATLSTHGYPGIRRLDIAAGHVGMIVGHDAPRQLWAPLADWLTS